MGLFFSILCGLWLSPDVMNASSDRHKYTHSLYAKISESEVQELADLFPSLDGLEARLRLLWSVTLQALRTEKRFCFPEPVPSQEIRIYKKVRMPDELLESLQAYARSCCKETSEMCGILTSWGISLLLPLGRADEYRREEIISFIRKQLRPHWNEKRFQFAKRLLSETMND